MAVSTINWAFIACCGLLAVGDIGRNRLVWVLLLLACYANMLLNALHFDITDYPEQALIYALMELVTMWALLTFVPCRLAVGQVLILNIAWIGHVALFLDLSNNTDLVFSSYDSLITLIMIGQLTLGINGLFTRYSRYLEKRRGAIPYSYSGIALDSPDNPSNNCVRQPTYTKLQ